MKEKENRKHRVSTKIKSLSQRPRLYVYRSNKYTYCQVIDHKNGKVLAQANEMELKEKKGSKSERAREVGRILATRALTKKVKKVTFLRGHYKYHGRVKAVAEGAREKGLVF